MASHDHLDDVSSFYAIDSKMILEAILREEMLEDVQGNLKVEETAPGVATGMILSLRESLKNCQDELSRCQTKLEDVKSEIQKWRSAFQNESFIPQGANPGSFSSVHYAIFPPVIGCIVIKSFHHSLDYFYLSEGSCFPISLLEPRFVVNYLQTLRSSEESLREQLEKAKKKEAAFIVTFAKREQEIAELKSAVRDLRAQLKPPSMQVYQEMNLVEEKDKKVKELQDNIAAVSFTPQSKMGKMLMAKCRTLQEENEEIGNQANEGKMHELAMKLASQKSQNAELRSQFEGLCKHMEKLTGDVDRSNELVVILQEKLEEKDDEIRRLKHKLQENGSGEEQTELATDVNANDDGVTPLEVQTEN
ncbi:hypothetical protein DH2020_042724 [Rehmannia glutinosa]|uniref:FKBP12-interacting protein of 37 kDa n=1 Tax=Rehmannia glutinosa TaxID=99300 RepID=A0ABR0UM40_REHGL